MEKDLEKKRIETSSIMPHEVPVLTKTKIKDEVIQTEEDLAEIKSDKSEPEKINNIEEKVDSVRHSEPAEEIAPEEENEQADLNSEEELTIIESEPTLNVKSQRRKIDLDNLPSGKIGSKGGKPKRKRVRVKKAGQDI